MENPKKPQSFAYESMGSHFAISIWDEISPDFFSNLKQEIIALSNEFDKKYSRFIKTSLVWQMAGNIGEFQVDTDFMEMLKVYFKLYELSEKKFTPLIGFTISDMGYDENYTLVPKDHIRATPDLIDTVKIISDTTILLTNPVLFDFGGVGKGYFVDKIAHFLKEKSIKRFLVNGSGDIYYSGNGQKITAGLEHPQDPKKVVGIIDIFEGSLCASGISKRNWGTYHHIIDPVSLSSPSEIVSTWVLSDSATVSDALATCLFLVNPANFTKKFSFEYGILNKDYKIKRSANFSAELF